MPSVFLRIYGLKIVSTDYAMRYAVDIKGVFIRPSKGYSVGFPSFAYIDQCGLFDKPAGKQKDISFLVDYFYHRISAQSPLITVNDLRQMIFPGRGEGFDHCIFSKSGKNGDEPTQKEGERCPKDG